MAVDRQTLSPFSNEDTCKRLIYIANVRPKYYCGGPDKYTQIKPAKLQFVKEIIGSDYNLLLKTIESVNDDPLIPYRKQIFNVLCSSMLLEEATKACKTDISTLIPKIMKYDEDFFDYVHCMSVSNKHRFSKSARRVVRLYYKDKTPSQLARYYANTMSVHGWTHKRLITVCHVKAESPAHEVVLSYIMKKKCIDTDEDEDKKNLELMKKCDELRKTSDKKLAVPLITELKASMKLVDGLLRKSVAIWIAIVPNMSIKEILQMLPKLYKYGFLKKDKSFYVKVSEILTTSSKVIECGIHPIEVFIQMKNFESGGKPLDPKLLHHLVAEKNVSEEDLAKYKAPVQIKSPTFINTIQKCMNISINNVKGVNKRFLITVDATNKMDTACIGNRNISSVEAAAAFLWYFLRTENHVTVAVFKETDIEVIPMDKKSQIHEYVQKIKENENEYLLVSSPIEWASKNKKKFDVFINFIHHYEYHSTIPKDVKDTMKKPVDVLKKYRQKLALPDAKLINVCFTSTKLTIADGSANILDIAGLDSEMPKVIEAFSRGHFC
ncbi:RNA-binding protein RO60 [Diabrotica undecimpunctata]|uniref:RNA-binding protein RO60 n=1 Tax=Diabrotica undecimpunctata TaxID=50387 RepID=UPI003B64038B